MLTGGKDWGATARNVCWRLRPPCGNIVVSALWIEIEPRCNEDDDDDANDANDEVKHDAVVNVMNIMSSIVSEVAATLFFDEIIVDQNVLPRNGNRKCSWCDEFLVQQKHSASKDVWWCQSFSILFVEERWAQ